MPDPIYQIIVWSPFGVFFCSGMALATNFTLIFARTSDQASDRTVFRPGTGISCWDGTNFVRSFYVTPSARPRGQGLSS